MIMSQRVDHPRPPVVVVVVDSTGIAFLCNFGLGPGGLSAGDCQREEHAALVFVLLAHDQVDADQWHVMVWCSKSIERSQSC